MPVSAPNILAVGDWWICDDGSLSRIDRITQRTVYHHYWDRARNEYGVAESAKFYFEENAVRRATAGEVKDIAGVEI